jgi:hypothetical protein
VHLVFSFYFNKVLRGLVVFWSLGHHLSRIQFIESAHLFPKLLHRGESVAARVLESLGADSSNSHTQATIPEIASPLKEVKNIFFLVCYHKCYAPLGFSHLTSICYVQSFSPLGFLPCILM